MSRASLLTLLTLRLVDFSDSSSCASSLTCFCNSRIWLCSAEISTLVSSATSFSLRNCCTNLSSANSLSLAGIDEDEFVNLVARIRSELAESTPVAAVAQEQQARADASFVCYVAQAEPAALKA